MKLPKNPYTIKIVTSSVGGDDTAFSAFEKGCKLTAEQILNFLKEHNRGTVIEVWNHGVLERRGPVTLALDSEDWQELMELIFGG